MKKRGLGLVFLAFLALPAILVVPAASQTYDNSPAQDIIIPECIWAPATGGGTWVTELQITPHVFGTVVSAYFFYGTSKRTIADMWTSGYQTAIVKFPNILSTLQTLDPSFAYYGKVGALWLHTQDAGHPIQAQARTVNGNYGKTFPGLNWVDSNSANMDRFMAIPNLTQNAKYRTFVGIFNATAGTSTLPVVGHFDIIDESGQKVGSGFTKNFAAGEFKSFNPFVEAGVGSGTFDNCWLIVTCSSEINGPGSRGLFCFGSSANNYTNDTSAHIAVQID